MISFCLDGMTPWHASLRDRQSIKRLELKQLYRKKNSFPLATLLKGQLRIIPLIGLHPPLFPREVSPLGHSGRCSRAKKETLKVEFISPRTKKKPIITTTFRGVAAKIGRGTSGLDSIRLPPFFFSLQPRGEAHDSIQTPLIK